MKGELSESTFKFWDEIGNSSINQSKGASFKFFTLSSSTPGSLELLDTSHSSMNKLMKGDYYRYLADFKFGDDKEAVDQSLKTYQGQPHEIMDSEWNFINAQYANIFDYGMKLEFLVK
ncbi:hypothetical protein L6452_32671 [Arctium lappa]|uniref:Uncharacterized protein n=1 Tax=Arctium lappa TaxID=4217 RepID=A0ACB8Z5M2_ARCLA|nr:hypothetical protein L6452_32671 [Arctium lappa]